ncbi:MAG TPA: glycosyltransferase family 9 protein [Gemmatimonadaceae bacterium]|nr:glycosyltransferase family 9 protein [Gemmatimonadaceae bacterium]
MKPPRVLHPRQVLVIQLRRLGDVVLTTALLEDLRRAFPHTPVDFLVGDRAAPLLEHHPLIRERLIYDRAHPRHTWRVVRNRRYDWIVDPQSSPRTAPLALASGAPVRAGFGVRGWGWAYTHRLPRAGRAVEYVARERQRLLEMLGVSVGAVRTSLALTEQERAAGRTLLAGRGIRSDAPVVGCVLSAGELEKEWPAAHFARLADSCAGAGIQAVLFEMPGDHHKASAASEGTRALVRIPVPDLRDFMSALSACDVFVSADTGPAHIASALRVPRVTIFGPEPPAAWAPPNDPSVFALRADSARNLGIVPKSDPRASTLTAEVPPAQVFEGVRTLLARQGRVGDGATRSRGG